MNHIDKGTEKVFCALHVYKWWNIETETHVFIELLKFVLGMREQKFLYSLSGRWQDGIYVMWFLLEPPPGLYFSALISTIFFISWDVRARIKCSTEDWGEDWIGRQYLLNKILEETQPFDWDH